MSKKTNPEGIEYLPESIPGRNPFLRKIKIFLIFILIFGVVCFIIGASCSEYIPPWDVGIKQIKFGFKKGYSDKIYKGGYLYLLIPFKEDLHHVPINLQVIDVLCTYNKTAPGTTRVKQGTGVEVPTTDGSKVNCDISIIYRIFENSEKDSSGKIIHGGPKEVVNKAGLPPEKNLKRLITESTLDACKRALGSLTTDDYYNSPKREAKVLQAINMLNKGWTDDVGVFNEGWHVNGVDIVAIKLRAYYYEETIDKAIAQKNLQFQEEKLRSAEEKVSENDAMIQKVSAEGDAKIQVLMEDATGSQTVIMASAERYEQTAKSNGDLEVQKAKALQQKMKADALEKEGAELYITQELSPLVTKLKGGVVTDINPFDLGQWTKLLIGDEIIKEGEKK